jgi:hypothetical protein
MKFFHSTLKNLLFYNKFFFFSFVCLVLLCFTYWNYYFYYNEDILASTYGEQISFERISMLLANGEKYFWITLLFLPIVILFRVTYTAFAIIIGGFFTLSKEKFGTYFNIAMKAEIAVVMMYFAKWIFIEFIWDMRTLDDLSLIPISLYHYFAKSNLPLWSKAALSYINIWEVLYMLIIAGMLGLLNNKPLKSNILFVLSTYGVALVFWIVILTYIAITLS